MATSSTPPALATGNEPTPAAVPVVARQPGTGYLQCDFCDCKLTKTGEVYEVSEKARSFRDDKEKHGKAVEKLNEQITELQRQITAKDAEISALKGSPATERKRGITIR